MQVILKILSCIVLLNVSGILPPVQLFAQEPPPRPISVFVVPGMGLSFGAFAQGASGGNVIVSPTGSRSGTGNITLIQMGFTFSPAIYEVEANTGTLVSIMNGPDAILTSSNGGSMTLHIGDSYPASPFIATVTPPGRMQVRIGGTLYVGSPMANPPGTYNGTFTVTFIQE